MKKKSSTNYTTRNTFHNARFSFIIFISSDQAFHLSKYTMPLKKVCRSTRFWEIEWATTGFLKKRYYRFCKAFSNPSVLYVISMNFGKKKRQIYLKKFSTYHTDFMVLSCKLWSQTSNKIDNL